MARLTERSQGKRRPKSPRADELSEGVLAVELVESKTEREASGRLKKGSSTAQRKGGQALRNRTILSHKAGLSGLAALPEFQSYISNAKAFAKATVNAMAKSLGGGHCSAAAASIITSASLQLAASRFLFDKAAQNGDADLFGKASRLADASRANLLSAADLVANSAEPVNPADRWRALAEAKSK